MAEIALDERAPRGWATRGSYGDGKTVAPGKGDAYERIEIEWAA